MAPRTRPRLAAGVRALGLCLALGLAARPAPAATLYGVSSIANLLVRFESDAPDTITDALIVVGTTVPNERIVGIDFRPRSGQLYAFGLVPFASDTGRLYTIDLQSGRATLVGAPSAPIPTAGLFQGFDFNPAVDRIRLVNDGDENLRLNPTNGALAADDSNLTPGAVSVTAVAYDRPFDRQIVTVPPNGAPSSTLYAIDVAADTLAMIGGVDGNPSPNGGVVTNVGPLGVNTSGDVGFDIDSTGDAFAAITVGGVNGLYTIDLTTGAATLIGAIGDGNLGIGGLAALPRGRVVVGADKGSEPRVQALDGPTLAPLQDLLAFDATFRKGVRVAAGDVNGDGVPDLIAGMGRAGSEIRGFDGRSGLPLPAPLGQFLAFDASFKKGVSVAVGDVDGDSFDDVIAGAGPGAPPEVAVFLGANGSELVRFPAFDDPKAKGGVSVAAGDFDLNGLAEIVVGAGRGAEPAVRLFGSGGAPISLPGLPLPSEILAYDASFRGGVFVAAGDVNGDGRPDIVTGPGKGAPEVRVFDGFDGALLGGFLAYDARSNGGVRVAVGDVNGDGRGEILTSPGRGPAELRAFSGLTFQQVDAFPVFEPGFKKGVFVAGARP
jgi:Domain of unknown function (DUF4394)/FG-GAP-like repeat/FG-GAP repeat